MAKSAIESANTMSAALRRPGATSGSVTVRSTWRSLAPRSLALSSRFRSRVVEDVLDHEEGEGEQRQSLAQDDARPPEDPDVGAQGLVEEPPASPQDDERDPEDVGRRDQGQERDEPERPAEPAGAARHRQGDREARR